MRYRLRATVVALLCASVIPIGTSARAGISRCPAGGTAVPAGAAIQSYLNAGAPGGAFCLASGTYHPAKQILPKQGQSLYGVPGGTVIDGTPLPSVFNGSQGTPSDVTNVGLYDLTVQNAKSIDIRTNSGWVLDDVIAQGSGEYGIVVRGTGPVVRDSIARNNDRFGISGGWSIDAVIEGNTLTNNNLGLNPPGYSGATHFTNTVGMQVLNNTIYANYGRGIWFDIDSADALVQGNTVHDEIDYPYPTRAYPIGDGIRIEISCRITVLNNVIYANQGPQIAVDGADDTTVQGNTVVAPAGQPAVRVAPQDDRSKEPLGGWKNCDRTLKTAVNDHVMGNDITQVGSVTYSGLLQKKKTSDTSGTTFDGDTYHVPSCTAQLWRWWNGTALVKVSFAVLRNVYHQELSGTCLVTPSG
jgi:Right handed beta helix region